MKHLILNILILLLINLYSYSQVEELDRIVYERVTFSNSEVANEKEYLQTVAYIANDYVKKYHKKDKLGLIVVIYDTPYDVTIDNVNKSLVSQLVNNYKKLDYGVYIRLPDSCLSLQKMFNLIDLGFSTKDSTVNCLQRYVRRTTWFPKIECYPSKDKIDSILDIKMSNSKKRFISRMMRKYCLKNTHCINKSGFK